MQSLEKRISVLDAAKPADLFPAIQLDAGETEADALRRCGIPADSANVLFIHRVIFSPGGARHARN